jgi:hypothetical protein
MESKIDRYYRLNDEAERKCEAIRTSAKETGEDPEITDEKIDRVRTGRKAVGALNHHIASEVISSEIVYTSSFN